MNIIIHNANSRYRILLPSLQHTIIILNIIVILRCYLFKVEFTAWNDLFCIEKKPPNARSDDIIFSLCYL